MGVTYHDDGQARFLHGDVRECLRELEAGSVHTVVTSPPYWGLRDYGTASWEGGDEACDHVPDAETLERQNGRASTLVGSTTTQKQAAIARTRCKCGAKRIDRQLGLEPTPEQYVENMVEVFREIRRVLRDDGTVWLNIGDSYATGNPSGRRDADRRGEAGVFTDGEWRERQASGGGGHVKALPPACKPKDLVGVPWMLAFALRADGWYLRSDIIWSKPNPMPESVTDRPTKAHEYLFLLSKRERYYYDADAIRDPGQNWGVRENRMGGKYGTALEAITGDHHRGLIDGDFSERGRNKRTVWTIATEPYPEAHFATFPTDLVEPCVLAGTSEHGCCSECGAPWERVVERSGYDGAGRADGSVYTGQAYQQPQSAPRGPARNFGEPRSTTTGWQPTCKHEAPRTACTVLDPFLGSGTTAYVAKKLGRRAIGIDLNEDYLRLAVKRCMQMGMVI